MNSSCLQFFVWFLVSVIFYNPFLHASDDYDCFSKNRTVQFSGKTYEDSNGDERFVSYLQVYLNHKKIASIHPKDFKKNSEPFKFGYEDSNLIIELDWYEKSLYFVYRDLNNDEEFKYLGKLKCI